MQDKHGLLSAPIPVVLKQLTLPMGLGIFAVLAFNLVDTWFISLLGTEPLAAISFTFPVTFMVTALAMGMGTGLSSHLAHYLGRGETGRARRFTTDGLLLAFVLVCLMVTLGLIFLDPMFLMLGATDALLPMIRDYMQIWFIGVPLLVIPMVGNAAIRATGDTRTPSAVMLVAGLLNGILTPLLIFGPGPFPELGIRGAALASAISWLLTFCFAIYLLRVREHLLSFKSPFHKELKLHWKQIFCIGLPVTLTNLLGPLSHGWVMWLLAAEGTHAVAAYGAGSRIEALALIGTMALASVMAPFVAQNQGAGLHQRSQAALMLAQYYTFWGQLLIYGVLLLSAPLIARIFTDDPGVQELLTLYLILIPASYGVLGIMMVLASTLNGMHKPIHSLAFNLSRLILLLLPLTAIAYQLWHIKGVFIAIVCTNLVTGLVARIYSQHYLRFA